MGLSELRRQESERRLEERHHRFAFIFSVAPMCGAMALAVLYIIVPATFEERHVYSEITRPHLGEFIRSTLIVPIVGAALGSLLAFLTIELLGTPYRVGKLLLTLLVTGTLFGMLIPIAAAITLPVNLFLVAAITNVDSAHVLIDDLLVAVFSTTSQLLMYWAESLYASCVSGLLVGLVSFVSLLTMRTRNSLDFRPAAVSLCIGIISLGLLVLGPFGIYEYLVRQLAAR
jgi:hypothetical protein